ALCREHQVKFALRTGELPFLQGRNQLVGIERDGAPAGLRLRTADGLTIRPLPHVQFAVLEIDAYQRNPRNSLARNPVNAAISSRARIFGWPAVASNSRLISAFPGTSRPISSRRLARPSTAMRMSPASAASTLATPRPCALARGRSGRGRCRLCRADIDRDR